MEEIKQELRQDNIAVKANAIAKLTYVCEQYYLTIHLRCFSKILFFSIIL